ncbi:hypothetical protein ACJU26_08965 [Acidithiobacillus sp. M4-SHS-6]|uniref:hypothetical protein n=1 Tax=Acidithiobacillus sp. M4-SHS-6 TaxID=3383024 RepID=UPI0039BECDD4
MKELLNYSVKPSLKKYWVRRGGWISRFVAEKTGARIREVVESSRRSLFYGVELEFPGPSQESILQAVGEADESRDELWYCKRDGSLPLAGVEVVSQAATERYHLHTFGWNRLWENLQTIPQFNSQEDRLWDKCGMHVHVGRAGLSLLAQWRIFALVFQLQEIFPQLVGRGPTMYARSLTGSYLEGLSTTIARNRLASKPTINSTGLYNRYRVLNPARRGTLEFRMMASPRNYAEFMERFEFVWAVTGFAANPSIADCISDERDPEVLIYPEAMACTRDNFFAWVAAQKLRFPYFHKLLVREGFLTELAIRDDGQLWLPFVDELLLTDDEIRAVPRRVTRTRRR